MPLYGGNSGNGDAFVANPLSQFAATTSAELAGVISNETGTGSLVFGTSPTIATPTITGVIAFPDDTRQTFNPGGTNAGINVGAFAGDPSTPVNGDFWYDSVANELTARINGMNVALGTAGGGGDALVANPLSQFAATTSAQLAGVLNDETGTGLAVFATSPTITTPTFSGAVIFQDNVRQTFNPGADNAGLNVGAMAGDPSTPSNGDLWYDSTSNELNGRINGVSVALGAGSGANTALSNLASVAINTSLLSDADIADALGSGTFRWNHGYIQNVRTGTTNTDVLRLQAYDVSAGDGSTFVTFMTLTALTVPTCTLQNTSLATCTVTTSLLPTTDDGAPLGSTTKNFSDLFLASGAVVNYANGNVVLTHTSGVLTLGTGNLIITTAGTATGSVATISGIQTLTNKRINTRIQSVTTGSTITPNSDDDDCVDVTALAEAATFAAPSGTPVNGQNMIIRIKDDGSARALTWNAAYSICGAVLPTTTVASKIHVLGFKYNTMNALNKWQLLVANVEA